MLFSKVRHLYLQTRSKLRRWKYFDSPWKGKINYWGDTVHFPDHCHLIDRVLHNPVFEEDLVNGIQRVIDDGCYIDIGANIGLLSIPILHSKKKTNVYSIEPSPSSASYLKRTWESSRFRDRWTLEEFIVGEQDGESEFFVHDASMGAFDGVHATYRAGEASPVTLPMRSLDSYWKEKGKPDVSCIKIDVEGYESSVLKGAQELVSNCHPCFFLEWNATNLKASGVPVDYLLDFCQQNDYLLIAFPNNAIVNSNPELKLRMTMTETFLLWPRSR